MVVYHLLVLLLSVMPIENRSFVNGLKHDGLSPIISLEEPVLLTSPTDRKNKASVRANKIEISILKRQIQEQQNFIRNLQEKSEAGLGKMNLRLVNGNSSREGRVEVYKDGVWGTVCDNGWDFNDAKVVCKQLFGLDGIPYSHAYFGQGTGLVLMDDVRCNGTESSLLQCDHKDNLHHSCDHSKDAGVMCMKAPLIRLSKQNEFQGRVEVYMNNTWGTICDNGWGYNDAIVVCRSLGYSEQGLAVPSTVFGIGSGPIHLDNVQCSGRETGLTDCPFSETHSCNHSQDVGVLCILPSQKLRFVNGISSDEGLVEVFVNEKWRRVCNNRWDKIDSNVACRILGYSGGFQIALPTVGESGRDVWFLDEMECNGAEDSLLKCARSVTTRCDHEAGVICYQKLNGQVRIGNGRSPDDGLVEVMVNNRWRKVCVRGWTSTEANVTCKSLGFPGGIDIRFPTQKDGMKDVWILPSMDCRGNETSLLDCEASGSGSCSNDEDAGTFCYHSSYIRLVNGLSPHEGEVEILSNGRWRSVYSFGWSINEATVACRSLKYSGGIPLTVSIQRKVGLWQIYYLYCKGNENSLLGCTARGISSSRPDTVAGVICYSSSKGRIRLVNGDSPSEGLVEVLVNGHWRRVCAGDWDKKAADVACRSLKFSGGLPISLSETSRNSRKNIWFLNDISCDGTEDSLLECVRQGSPSCKYYGEAGVICYNSPNATVRLVDGSLPHEGVVEVLVNGRWRSVCDSLWDKREANVTCGLLGYSGGIPVSLPKQRNPKKGIWRLPRMKCRGDEDSLLECPSSADDRCSEDGKAGVICFYKSNGTLRLVNGSFSHEGVVEVLVNGRWRTICKNGLEKKDADVTCKSLQYSGGIPLKFPYSGERKKDIWRLQKLGCNGNEDSLLECKMEGDDACYGHAGVTCYNSFNGTVRLVNGSAPHEGVVEVFAHDRWRSICSFFWDKNDAHVTCRSLGYSGGFPVSLPIQYEWKMGVWNFFEMNCQGNENSLSECSSEASNICYTYSDVRAGVVCYDTLNEVLRLVNGTSSNEGRVEVFINGTWGIICDDGWGEWDYDTAYVLCRSLGYTGDYTAQKTAYFGQGSGTAWIRGMSCWGYESSIFDCSYDIQKNHCGQYRAAGVRCQ